jgi:predicted transcriptional regulator
MSGTDMSQVPVRPFDADDRSNAIILSLGAKWAEPIRTCSLKWIIRKRVPLAISKPEFVYFHVNYPVSEIIGRGRVGSIEHVSLAFAEEHSEDLQMDRKQIRSYVGEAGSIGLFRLKQIQLARKSATLSGMREMLEYYPPQSFSFVSKKALPIIDRMCGF